MAALMCVARVLALFLLPTAVAVGGTVLVLNKSGNSLLLVDRATGLTAATLPTGDGPHEVAVTPDGKTAVVTNYGRKKPGNTLTVYDLPNKKVLKTISLGGYTRPHGIVFHPDGKKMIVTAEGKRALLVVGLESGKVERAIDTGQDTSHMVALSPKAERAYVPNIRSGSLSVIDLKAGKRLKILRTGRGAEGVDVSPDGREVWVTNRQDNTISIIDAQKLEIVATLRCGSFPIRLKFTPDGRLALVSYAFSGEVAVFDVAQRKETHRIKLKKTRQHVEQKPNMFRRGGALPIGIVIPPDGEHAFVACGGYDQLAVIHLNSFKVVGMIATGREPDGLAYSALSLRDAREPNPR